MGMRKRLYGSSGQVWDRTPVTGMLSELLTMLVNDFALVLTPA